MLDLGNREEVSTEEVFSRDRLEQLLDFVREVGFLDCGKVVLRHQGNGNPALIRLAQKERLGYYFLL